MTSAPHITGQNVSCVQGVRLQFVPECECYMSGHRSNVKGPMADPDGSFPLLEEYGVKKHVQTWDIWTGQCILSLSFGQCV